MQIMIDIESLSTHVDATILSIGAVPFDMKAGKVYDDQTFYTMVKYPQPTRHVDKDTEGWWSTQGDAAKEILDPVSGVDLPIALKDLGEFVPEHSPVWANGSTFDISVLEHAYREFELPIPWRYNMMRDMRTVKEFVKSPNKIEVDFDGVAHNARDDAIWQAYWMCGAYKEIMNK